MSVRGTHWGAWARDRSVELELTPVQSHVLYALAAHADPAGECYPALATLAATVRRAERVTSGALTDLERLGLIERRGRGPGRARLTRLRPDSRPTARQDPADDSRPTTSQGPSDSRPTATQEAPDSRSTASHEGPDSRCATAKTRGGRLPRLAAHRAIEVVTEEPHEQQHPPTPQGGNGREATREHLGSSLPTPPSDNGRRRSRDSYLAACAAYASKHFPDLGSRGQRAVAQAIDGGRETAEEVEAFIDCYWRHDRQVNA